MTETAEMIDPMTGEIIDQKELAEALPEQAREQGVSLLGPGGLLAGLTKNVLETALEAEITEHLGHVRHGPAESGNVRNGTRSKTVFTEVGPVEIDVPRDREGSFEPQIVKKRQRRLDGIGEVVLSLTARGLTTGEIAAHVDDVYGATVSKDTKVSEEMAEWANRPLDRVYPVVFIDAIHVKVRDGQVRNKPFYVVLGVTVNGERDILGIWAGDGGGEGAKYWLGVLAEKEPRRRGRVHRGLRRAQGLARGDHHGLGAGHGPDVICSQWWWSGPPATTCAVAIRTYADASPSRSTCRPCPLAARQMRESASGSCNVIAMIAEIRF